MSNQYCLKIIVIFWDIQDELQFVHPGTLYPGRKNSIGSSISSLIDAIQREFKLYTVGGGGGGGDRPPPRKFTYECYYELLS
jgi:hypothetical protein